MPLRRQLPLRLLLFIALIAAALMVLFVGASGRVQQREIVAASPL